MDIRLGDKDELRVVLADGKAIVVKGTGAIEGGAHSACDDEMREVRKALGVVQAEPAHLVVKRIADLVAETEAAEKAAVRAGRAVGFFAGGTLPERLDDLTLFLQGERAKEMAARVELAGLLGLQSQQPPAPIDVLAHRVAARIGKERQEDAEAQQEAPIPSRQLVQAPRADGRQGLYGSNRNQGSLLIPLADNVDPAPVEQALAALLLRMGRPEDGILRDEDGVRVLYEHEPVPDDEGRHRIEAVALAAAEVQALQRTIDQG